MNSGPEWEKVERPLLDSADGFELTAERYAAHLTFNRHYEKYWYDLVSEHRSPWTEYAYLMCLRYRSGARGLNEWGERARHDLSGQLSLAALCGDDENRRRRQDVDRKLAAVVHIQVVRARYAARPDYWRYD